jgi:hypothetical protein
MTFGEQQEDIWQLNIAEAVSRQFCSEHEHGQIIVNVRVGYIRDGTPGISLIINDNLAGEWTDSGAKSLSLNSDCSVVVHGSGGDTRYLVLIPGKAAGGEEISETEVAVRIHA